MRNQAGLYIHIPYCRNKCLYCDFYSAGLRIARWDDYIMALLNELKERKEEISDEFSTIYFGGGTPSLIPPEKFIALVSGLKSLVKIESKNEFTIEVNPEDVNSENIDAWLKMGVNRISLGVQSLDDDSLKLIGRRHDSDSALIALEKLKKNFENISVDVMFGIPGQTLNSYINTLESLSKFKPEHISTYSLMLEEGTAMTHLCKRNKIVLPEENDWIEMYEFTLSFLKENGYNRYEISNFSLPGKESKHNSLYWKGLPYLGIGPGAHSYDGASIRRANPADLKKYISSFREDKKGDDFYLEERLTEKELREEMIMTRLRMAKGLDLKEFKERFGEKSQKNLLQNSLRFIQSGDLKEKDGFLFFTDRGFFISDSILVELI